MNAPWTTLGTPAISIPMPLKSGLPLGLQLTAKPGQDAGSFVPLCACRDSLANVTKCRPVRRDRFSMVYGSSANKK